MVAQVKTEDDEMVTESTEGPKTMEIAASRSSERNTLWEGSSQFRHWRFSQRTLLEQRTKMNESAVNAIRNTFEADEPGSSEGIQFLTAQEEHHLVTHYVSKITQLCQHFRFNEEVEATAMTYLKRFFLKNTVMDWHPMNVMLTTLFLAAKTTNNPISLEAYVAQLPKTSPSDVLDLEFLVAQSLSFEFAVWHAHRALWGIWLDLQTLPDVRPEAIKDIYNAAVDHVQSSRLTDAEFIYTPPQIALASLYLASESLGSQWARAKGMSATEMDVIKEVAHLVSSEVFRVDQEQVREIDKRLRTCKNPEKVPGTAAYKKKQEAAEAHAASKRDKKHKAEKERESAKMEVDVFGNVEMIDHANVTVEGTLDRGGGGLDSSGEED
ncbi:hypothetical protein FRC14_002678 [Serendipita sp. 396]|nr:hypothetical protein FRC14_002678 [Serendipita sp. 396]KAG8782938.1 hypothetical protein FRC15_006023 [Serendipita sp. 397]KAG8798891.1 hypothetical protein FRC16_006333 [Serendipita sp. 398]KAG8869487.1 hypothetical protein FRC20_001353 [Serendipita sp. 405]